MKKIFLCILLCISIIFVFISSAIFVEEDRYAIVKRFGRVVAVYENAGLHFKIPFIDQISHLPKSRQMHSSTQSGILTKDKKAMLVDEYVVWRIKDPLVFLQAVGDMVEINERLDASVYNSVRMLLSSMEQEEIVSERGSLLNNKITDNMTEQMDIYGLEIIDVQIKMLDLPLENREAVYSRMISERLQIAAAYTAEGEKEAAIIKNEADREAAIIISEAESKAQAIIATGESEYMRMLHETLDTEDKIVFYEFVRSLDALRIAMDGEKTLILPFDSPITEWFMHR